MHKVCNKIFLKFSSLKNMKYFWWHITWTKTLSVYKQQQTIKTWNTYVPTSATKNDE